MKLKAIELFAGVGGFRIGLNHIKEVDKNGKAIENGAWDFVYSNQYEPATKKQHAFECYKKRFGDCDNTDISKVDKSKIPNHHLLTGGFPCQDYSVARTNSEGLKGKKGILFWEIAEVLEKKQTPLVLLENVDRLLKSPTKDRGKDFLIILKTFNDLGYNVNWQVINASDYGMQQKRKRVFIFAYRKDIEVDGHLIKKAFPVKIINKEEHKENTKFKNFGYMIDGKIIECDVEPIKEKEVTLGNIIKISKKYNTDLNEYLIEDDKISKWKYLKSRKKIPRINKKTGKTYTYSEGQMDFPDSLDKPARTILTSESSMSRTSHIIMDPDLNKYRKLTEIETELIQGFPVNWTDSMPKGKRYFTMGNALETGIIERLELYLREIAERIDL